MAATEEERLPDPALIASNSRRARSLSDLPQELLVRLLSHVPVQHRLQVCARLSTKCKTAATAATTAIKVHGASTATMFQLQPWLESYGPAIISFDLKPSLVPRPYTLLQLPCANLRQLRLTDVLVQLTAAPGQQQPGIVHSCKSLTSLCLRNCNLLDSTEQLAGLSALQALQEFEIGWDAGSSRRQTQPVSILPGSLLCQLVQLTRVDLCSQAGFASLQHLSCLTDLQELKALLPAGAAPEKFTGARHLQKLTRLHLNCVYSEQALGFNETRGLCQATSLQDVSVWRCKAFRASVLRQLGTLRRLRCMETGLVGGTSAMLAVLPFLTALSYLELSGTLQHPAVQMPDYTALACLSQLQVLLLSRCSLPARLWQQMLGAGVRMHSVIWLTLSDLSPESLLDSADFASLVQCFPSLSGLHAVRSTQPSADLSPLQRLQQLRHLSCSTGDAGVAVLASLQRLSSLVIEGPSSVTDRGLLQLTALSLSSLRATGDLSADAATGTASAAAGGGPVVELQQTQALTVSQQLLACCMKSAACQPLLLNHVNEGLRHEVKDLQQQLADIRAELATSKAQATAQRAQDRASLAVARLAAAQEAAKVAAREAALAAAGRDLSSREAAVASARRDLSSREATLAADRQLLDSREADLAAGRKDLDSWEADLAADRRNLDSRKAELVRAVRALDARAAQHKQSVQQQNDALLRSEQQLASRSAGVSMAEEQLQDRFAAADARERQIAAAEAQFGSVAAREQRVAAMEGAVAAREQRVAAAEAWLRGQQQPVMLPAVYAPSPAPWQPVAHYHWQR